MKDPNAEMHRRSGAIHEVDPMIALFYDLLRDHVAPGVLEDLVRDACKSAASTKVYSNGWLAEHAKDIVNRLDDARRQLSAVGAPVTK